MHNSNYAARLPYALRYHRKRIDNIPEAKLIASDMDLLKPRIQLFSLTYSDHLIVWLLCLFGELLAYRQHTHDGQWQDN